MIAKLALSLWRGPRQQPADGGKAKKYVLVGTPGRHTGYTFDPPIRMSRDLPGNTLVESGRFDSQQGHDLAGLDVLLNADCHERFIKAQRGWLRERPS